MVNHVEDKPVLRVALLVCLLYAGGPAPESRWEPRTPAADLTGYTINGDTVLILDGQPITLGELGRCEGATITEAVVDPRRRVFRRIVFKSGDQ